MPTWSDDLKIGVSLLDSQHATIFEVCERLVAADPSRQRVTIDDDLRFLARYVEDHFAMEERLMRSIHYAKYESHHLEHVKFRQALEALLTKAEHDSAVIAQISAVVSSWLTNHIMKVDRELADVFKSSGSTAKSEPPKA